jgi:hypothetical protein
MCVCVNKELSDLYSLPNNVGITETRLMKRARQGKHMGNRRGAFRVLVRRPEGKTRLGLTSSRQEVILTLSTLK